MTYQEIKKIVKQWYRDEAGNPIELTDGQCEIFSEIVHRKHPRVHVMAHTRYGKSFTVALAVLTRICTFPEKWCIVAGREAQARIIISQIIAHTFDNQVTKQMLALDEGESLDRLRRERSKNRLVYKHPDGNLSEVFILSGDSKNKEKAGSSLMGFGAPNVILDESALVDDIVESKIFRMLGDSMDNFYFKIGNPFFRSNHFYTAFLDPHYHKINIDYHRGIAEGRITSEFIAEAKKKPDFSVLYENKFPEADSIDDKGWSQLITDKELELALVELPEVAWFGERVMGHDVARGGGNLNVWVGRTENYATQLGSNADNDLMSTTGTTIRFGKEFKARAENWFIDDTGVGAGETDRLHEQRHNCQAVKVGEKADDPTRFENRRAENYWRVKQWLNSGGKLNPKQDWSELLKIKYRAKDSTGRLQVMSKEEMRKNAIESPDKADALMLTFDKPATSPIAQYVEEIATIEDFDKFRAF